MCGRFTQSKTAAAIARSFDLDEVPDWQPRYNIAPTQAVPTISHASNPSGRQFRLLRWGLVPSWAKDLAMGAKLINARAETVAEKPSFRSALKQRRCLVLADGFYEWQRVNGKKQPYYFRVGEGEPFAFAGLWERWQGDGTVVETCTIITTQANELLQAIHDRMPVILPAKTYDVWLDPTTPTPQLQNLLQPFDAAIMQGYPVSTMVNSPTKDTAECVNSL